MEPEGSLPYSQVPAACPYPEPDRSTPCHTSHFLRIHFNITSHLSLGLPSGIIPSGFPVHTSPLLHTCYNSCPFILLDLITQTILGEEYSSLSSSLNVSDQVSHPYKITDKSIVLYILSLHFWIANWKTRNSALNDSKHSLTSICS